MLHLKTLSAILGKSLVVRHLRHKVGHIRTNASIDSACETFWSSVVSCRYPAATRFRFTREVGGSRDLCRRAIHHLGPKNEAAELSR